MKATHRLSDIRVDFVSLVSSAAVRDPSDPTKPQRFLLTKSANKAKNLGKRTLNGRRMTEQQLNAMHDRATSGRWQDQDQEVSKMAGEARKTIKKFEASVAELRKADPTMSEYDAHAAALRKHADVRALQDAYLEVVSPTPIAKSDDYAPPSVGADAAVQLRKSAAEIKRPGQSDYDAMVEALRRNPELGRYREVA